MKKSALMIICNGENFIKHQLDNLYDKLDEIIIVEGADNTYRKIIKSITSTDKTVEMIKSYSDPDNKIKLFQGDFKDKVRMSAFGCDKITGDYIYQVDSDEFADKEIIDRGFDILNEAETALIPQRWYYKWGNTYLRGNKIHETIDEPNRFFRNQKANGLFISHMPRSGYRRYSDDKFIEVNSKIIDNGYGYHFLAIFRQQLEDKMKYYATRGDTNNEVVRVRLKEFDEYKKEDVGIKTIPTYYDVILKIDQEVKFKFETAQYI